MKKRVTLVLPLIAALAACQTTGNDGMGEDTSAACGANKVQSYVGAQLTTQTRIDILTKSEAEKARFIDPKTVITEDYVLTRLNVRTDANGKIQSINCG